MPRRSGFHPGFQPGSSSGFRSGFARFRRRDFGALFTPRKPRHRLVRIAIGVLGLCLLLALVFLGVFVGAAMVAVGVLWKVLKSRGKPVATRGDAVDGEYRVVPRQALPSGR